MVARLIQLAHWHTSPAHIPWLQFKKSLMMPFYLPGLLWSSSVSPRHIAPLNGIMDQCLYLWTLYKERFELLSRPHRLASFLGDPQSPLAFNADLEFATWATHSLVTYDSLLQGTSFCSFEHLQHNYALSKFYKYLQIRNFFTNILTQDGNEARTPFENLYHEGFRDRGTCFPSHPRFSIMAKS